MSDSSLPSWKPSHLLAAYALFAALSTAINLGTQHMIVLVLSGRVPNTLAVSIGCGTIAGFVSKYLFDKHLIFFDHSRTRVDETRKVALYGGFSILTTLVFWSAEVGAYSVFGTQTAKYAGAVVGLAVGYGSKFLLDRRFTFTDAQA